MFKFNDNEVGKLIDEINDIYFININTHDDLIELQFLIERLKAELGFLLSFIKFNDIESEFALTENNFSNRYYFEDGIFNVEDFENMFWDLCAKEKEILNFKNENNIQDKPTISRERNKVKKEIPTKLLSENEVAKLFISMQNLNFITNKIASQNAIAIQTLVGFNNENMRKNLGTHDFSYTEQQNILDFLKTLSEKVNKMPTS